MGSWPAKRTAGLDQGSLALKAVAVKNGLFGLRLSRAQQIFIPREEGELAHGLADLGRSFKSGGSVVLSLSGSRAFFRWLDLPRMSGLSRAKQRQAAAYALENHLPVGLESLAVDVGRWLKPDKGSSGGEGTRGLVFGLSRQAIAQALDEAAQAGFKVERVSLDTMGLLAAAERAGVENGVVVDLGHSKTTVLCLAQGELIGLGFVDMAGEELDRHLASARDIPLAEARAVKERLTEPKEANELFGPVLKELGKEVGRIVRAAFPDHDRQPEGLFLSGGTSRLPGLPGMLGSALKLDSSPLNPLRRPVDPELVPALGLALAKPEFNLGRELIPQQSARRLIVLTIGVLAVVLILGGANLYQGLTTRRQTLARLIAAEEKLVRQSLPHLTRIVSPLRQVKGELDKAKAELSGLETGSSGPVLDTLLALDKVARAGAIKISEVVIDGPRMNLSGRAASFEALAGFQEGLAAQAGFSEVNRQSGRMGGPGQGVLFRLRMKR